jgi:hypothetical protein
MVVMRVSLKPARVISIGNHGQAPMWRWRNLAPSEAEPAGRKG